MSIRITPAVGSVVEFADVADGFIVAPNTRTWLMRPKPSLDRNAVYPSKSPNVVGQQVKRGDFDSKDLTGLRVIYVHSSPDQVLAMFYADQSAVSNQACEVEIGSVEYPACEVVEFEPLRDQFGRQVKPTGRGTYRLQATLSFLQLRKA